MLYCRNVHCVKETSVPMPAASVSIARYLDKTWDWEAFPANVGFPELDRAQMRFIGTGGSPKPDPTTLLPGAFTCSLIFQPPQKRAAIHFHAVEELFFVHSGSLTMIWQFGEDVVEFVLGPGDAVLNPPDRPHGFRNDTESPIVLQIMVATASKMLPTYTEHPSYRESAPMRLASPERVAQYMPDIVRYVARASHNPVRTTSGEGELVTVPYVMDASSGGQVTPTNFSFAVSSMTRGSSSPIYSLPVEEAFMVTGGVLGVESVDATGATVLQRFAKRDLAFVPAGVPHRIRNNDPGAVTFATITGAATATPFAWLAARRAGQ